MRRTLFNLARAYCAGFAQVLVTCPVDVCITRNISRANPVPDAIIKDMADKFEIPATSHDWERHTIQISSYPLKPNFPWESVIHFCEESIVTPDDTAEKEANRAANLTNLAHQFDLQARKLISEAMKSAATTMNPKTMQILGKDLSALKQLHIASIHKRTCHTDLNSLTEVMEAFQGDLHDHVRRIK